MNNSIQNIFAFEPVQFSRDLLAEVGILVKDGSLPTRRGEFTLWTDAIKHWLASRARQLNLRPLYCDRMGSAEFMLDMVWWLDGPGGHAVLACESELGNTRDPRRNPGRIAEDFDKLLSFKAPIKLMIFDSYSKTTDGDQTQLDVLRELDRYLCEYGDHRKGEQYLIIDVSAKQTAWYCRVVEDGEQTSLRFEKLDLLR